MAVGRRRTTHTPTRLRSPPSTRIVLGCGRWPNSTASLWCSILHQGNVYDVTAPALPFVLVVLVDREVARPVLLSWLGDLGWTPPLVWDCVRRAVEQADDFTASTMLHEVTRRAFPDGAGTVPVHAVNLDRAQRDVLEFLASGTVAFTRGNEILQTGSALTDLGLPADAVRLTAWLEGDSPAYILVVNSWCPPVCYWSWGGPSRV